MSIIAPSPFAQPSGTVNAMSAPVTLIIADDHPLFRTALKAVVGQLLPTAKTVEAESLETLIQAVVSAEEEPATMRRALDFGATGFIPKSAALAQIGNALRTMLAGEVWLPDGIGDGLPVVDDAERDLAARVGSLTPQQFRVLMLLSDGRLNKQIAGDLDVAEATVSSSIAAPRRRCWRSVCLWLMRDRSGPATRRLRDSAKTRPSDRLNSHHASFIFDLRGSRHDRSQHLQEESSTCPWAQLRAATTAAVTANSARSRKSTSHPWST
jgi:DNA-binding NarL/FixJ family response regulator